MNTGEHFTCVWSAIAFLHNEENNESVPDIPCRYLEDFLAEFAKSSKKLNFNKLQFRNLVSEGSVSFSTSKEFLLLLKHQMPFPEFVRLVREFCWSKVRTRITDSTEADLDLKVAQLTWDVFNLNMTTSYPPKLTKQGANLCMNQLFMIGEEEEKYGHWKIEAEQPWTGSWAEIFQLLFKVIGVLCGDFMVSTNYSILEKLHRRCVEEIASEGVLFVNAKQGHNMFSWSKNYVTLSPSGIAFYKDVKTGRVDKNLVSIISFDDDLIFEREGHFIGFFRHLTYCWRIRKANDNNFSVLISGRDEKLREDWFENAYKIQECNNRLTTPYAELVKQISAVKGVTKKKLENAVRQTVTKRPHVMAEDEPKAERVSRHEHRQSLTRGKIHALFVKHDKDGNGFLDLDEFQAMIKELDINLSATQSEEMFGRIQSFRKDKGTEAETEMKDKVACSDFYAFLMNLAVLDTGLSSFKTDAKIKQLLVRAEAAEGKAFDLGQLLDYLEEKHHNIQRDQLQDLFQELSEDASRESLTNFFIENEKRRTVAEILENEFNVEDFNLLDHVRKEDAKEVEEIIRHRWDKFKSFKRTAPTNEARGFTVMAAPGPIKADALPGEWSLMDLVMAQFEEFGSKEVEPRHVVVDGVTWNSPSDNESHGQIVFPRGFSGEIPVDIATNQNLQFYGCCLADKSQEKVVTLLYRHGTQDFEYKPEYLEAYVKKAGGGAGIERHMFEHMDSPLDDDSGFFILGKMTSDREIALTAFKILKRQVLYVPRNVIHSNDYLRGTWRTMLSDAAKIDHVYLKRRQEETSTELEPFHFSFNTSGLL